MYPNSLLFGLAGFIVLVSAHASSSTVNSSSILNTTTYKEFGCGVSAGHGSAHFNDTVRNLHYGTHSPGTASHKASIHARQTTMINAPAVFHIVTDEASEGTITQDMADQQIAAMNTIYNNYNVNFTLINTTFTANDAWSVGESSDDTDMKTALRQGNYSTLNIYFQTNLTGGMLGTCELPSDIGSAPVDPSTYVTDGCNVNANTMPGGTEVGYNMGKTAVHETGHWLGLLHVFEGYACYGDGDFIGDTPLQSTSTSGCPTQPAKDSCNNATGVDAIHNYMDYSTDACYEEFTPLQQARIADMWTTYRQGR